MKDYKYETAEFGISPEGIHLLRSRYNYETLPFDQIQELRFVKAKILNNWFMILVIGLASVVFSIFYAFVLLDVLNDENVKRIYIQEILLPFLPMVFGLFMIYSSLKTGPMMVIYYGKRNKRLPLGSLGKEGVLGEFINDMNSLVYHKSTGAG